MQVLEILSHEDYGALVPYDPQQYLNVIRGGFTGLPMLPHWQVLDFYVPQRARKQGDFLALTLGTFAFTQRVLDAFGKLFSTIGEVLPIGVDHTRWYALNVLRQIDALDVSRSECRTLPGGKIAKIDRHVFVADAVEGESIFRIKQPIGGLYTTSGQPDRSRDFYQRVIDGKYNGLFFRRVSDILDTHDD